MRGLAPDSVKRYNLVPLSFGYISTEDYASAMGYGAVAESVRIDTLRVLHRQPRRALIARIVREQLHGAALEAVLAGAINTLPPEQQNKFTEDTRYEPAASVEREHWRHGPYPRPIAAMAQRSSINRNQPTTKNAANKKPAEAGFPKTIPTPCRRPQGHGRSSLIQQRCLRCC